MESQNKNIDKEGTLIYSSDTILYKHIILNKKKYYILN